MSAKDAKPDHHGFCARPLCPFCSKPWTDKMVRIFELDASQGCDTCGYGGGISGVVDIRCESCSKLIYRKEFSDR